MTNRERKTNFNRLFRIVTMYQSVQHSIPRLFMFSKERFRTNKVLDNFFSQNRLDMLADRDKTPSTELEKKT
uniref:Uncharacterized protein n=1 Tax=Arion vulgaris TaxID=1028688 RepID=A0A0B6ZX58_9EUPU